VSRPLLAPLVVGNEVRCCSDSRIALLRSFHHVTMACMHTQEGIKKLESIVHPLVTTHRQKFLQSIAEQADQKLVVLDIPLLFETHGEDQVRSQSLCLDLPSARALSSMCKGPHKVLTLSWCCM